MKTYNTQQLIEHLENSDYTDIIFDFDATIAHLIIDWSYARENMKKLSVELWLQKEHKEMNSHMFAELIITQIGQAWKDSVDAILLKAETDFISDIVENRALTDFIRNNSWNYTFHILSNNMDKTLENAIKKLNIEKYFVNVYGRDKVYFSKPHPEWIETIIESTNKDKKQFIMVGDNPDSDWEAASRAWIDYYCIDMYL